MWVNAGYSLSPSTSLTGNIGFDEFATHTKIAHNNRDKMPILNDQISVPNRYQPKINVKADKICAQINMGIHKTIQARIQDRLKRSWTKRANRE
jgi:hypothetical protein